MTSDQPVETGVIKASVNEAGAAQSTRRRLIDMIVAAEDFTDFVFASSHGAVDTHLGAGLLYYALGTLVRSQVSVCIGSGGGFVPALMRRAQIDAGLSPSSTYLVDANLPELAFGSPIQTGGWMTEENAFLQRESDIQVLPMLSIDAAKLFALEGLRIDYLHIDGDHSSAGVLADFEAYAPLLGDQAVITLHDLRMASVIEALTKIQERHSDIQLLAFPEIGAGTGVLRRAVSPSVPRRSQKRSEFVDQGRKTAMRADQIRTVANLSQHKASFERWSYLHTKTYQLRYKLAAEFFDEPGATIMEIGGFPNSVLSVVRQAKIVHLVEPYTPQEFVDGLRALGEERQINVFIHRGRLAAAAPIPTSLGRFNLVFLGLDLGSGAATDADWTEDFVALLSLASAASRVVLEIPGYEPSRLTFEHLVKILEPRIVGDITLDLSKDPVAESYHIKDSRSVRRLVAMEVERPVDVRSPVIQALVGLASDEMSAVRRKADAPTKAAYEAGTTIGFDVAGTSTLYTREGWALPEKRHRWMCDDESRIVLSLDRLPDTLIAASTTRLVLTARPFVVKGAIDQQALTIRINGESVHQETHSAEGDIEVRVPTALLFKAQPARIAFIHPDGRRPCDLVAGSRDRKVLSFAVSRLRLTIEH